MLIASGGYSRPLARPPCCRHDSIATLMSRLSYLDPAVSVDDQRTGPSCTAHGRMLAIQLHECGQVALRVLVAGQCSDEHRRIWRALVSVRPAEQRCVQQVQG